MTAQSTIQFDGVSHFFTSSGEDIHLFDGLSYRFLGGQVTSIVGPSGAGKSSLLALAAGLETPRGGVIRHLAAGREMTSSAFRQHSGFIFQHFHLLPEMDALGNLALPLRLKGHRGAFEEAAKWLGLVGLDDRAGHRPNQLSGGEQQRLAIARAFISRPAFIFADEPTGNLDQKTAATITGLMMQCAENTGCGLVIVTHSHDLARRAQTQLSLTDGRLEQVA